MNKACKTGCLGMVLRRATSLVFVVSVLCPVSAYAHVGAGTTSGIMDGLTHPIAGLDHLCAMLAVGLWASQCRGRVRWLAPLTFVVVMAIGGMFGMAGVAIPLAERGVAASVLVLGVLVTAAVRLPIVASVLLIGLFALFHGHTHGVEMPATASGVLYGLGFVLATAMLHVGGFALGRLVERHGRKRLVQYAGGVVSVFGMYLCLT